ncbi:MAG: deoxyribonuclease IV [bacterium]|nr:deoxyribonuclease IV [bacterium]
METKLLFGPAGTPHSSKSSSSVDGVKRIAELGLGCMELEFVQGVRMGAETAKQVQVAMQEAGVRLSVHAPYYINLTSKEIEKQQASIKRILDSARIGWLCGADSVVFHAAFYQGEDPKKVYQGVKSHLQDIVAILKKEKNQTWIRPETTGKGSQFGTVEEIIQLSLEIDRVLPCVDFSHLHARSNGKMNSYNEFAGVLELLNKKLGRKALDTMHIHISGIKYGEKGEREHLNLKDSDFKYQELLKAFRDFKIAGYVICESPNLEEDALLLKKTYEKL